MCRISSPNIQEFHVTGMDPSRQIVLSITGDPCNVRRAGFFGGRELSPSQCSIDVTELWDVPPGGASSALCIDTQRICYQFPSSHQSFPYAVRVVKGALTESTSEPCFHQKDRLNKPSYRCWCVLEQGARIHECLCATNRPFVSL